MRIIMDFDVELGRKVLMLTAGSMEQVELIKKYSEEEVLKKCFNHGCKPYGFTHIVKICE